MFEPIIEMNLKIFAFWVSFDDEWQIAAVDSRFDGDGGVTKYFSEGEVFAGKDIVIVHFLSYFSSVCSPETIFEELKLARIENRSIRKKHTNSNYCESEYTIV